MVTICCFAVSCAADADVDLASRAKTDGGGVPTVPVIDQTATDGSTPELSTVAAEPSPIPSVTPLATVTPVPTATPLATPTAMPTATPVPEGPCEAGPLNAPDPNRPVYRAAIDIDPPSGMVSGRMQVQFTPDLAIDELIVRLWPNSPRPAAAGLALDLSDVSIDGQPAAWSADDSTLVRVELGERGRAAGETVRLALSFSFTITTQLKSRISGGGDHMRLGSIVPLLPWEPGVGWATEPATALFAEAVMSPTADWSVEVNVPDGFDVLASGVLDSTGTWQVQAARDFAISVGRFSTVSATAFAPEPVLVTVGMHETVAENPQVYLDKVVDSLEQFSERWGQYPWPSLTFAVTPNLSGGIEFPTHIMQGPGTSGRTTSHEVGHMFFYSLVGNNQGRDPWLDEGITSYAEFTYEGTQPGAYEIPVAGVGQATQPMTFWAARSESYYRSVYSQTGFALQRLGPRDEVDCALAHYVAANAYGIATPADFVEAFEPSFPNVRQQLAELGVVIAE